MEKESATPPDEANRIHVIVAKLRRKDVGVMTERVIVDALENRSSACYCVQ